MKFDTSRNILTGGAGFLGHAVVERLRPRGAREIFIPRGKDYDLAHEADVAPLYCDANPDLVIHLASGVGGIGAHQANHAEHQQPSGHHQSRHHGSAVEFAATCQMAIRHRRSRTHGNRLGTHR